MTDTITNPLEEMAAKNEAALRRLEGQGIDVHASLERVRQAVLIDYLLPPSSPVRATFEALMMQQVAAWAEQAETEINRQKLLEGVKVENPLQGKAM